MSELETRKFALRILVVDDEPIVQESLAEWFRQDGYHVDTAKNGKEALRLIAQHPYDIALVDIKMPGMDGLQLQEHLAAANAELTVIIMTAFASVESAVTALKAGAYDYIVKPFDPDELSHLIKRASEHRSLRSENLRLKDRLNTIDTAPRIIGSSAGMQRVLSLISAVADTDATVLIQGESGTGKEVVARAIHHRSARRYNPMVIVNCGALPEGILESELFGHERGAFTGAQYRHKGKFEMADGGTIFLDEIGAVTPKVQVELLRILEEKTVTRLGGKSPIPVDFRVISATNQDLEEMIRHGEFREDLYWRLNVFNMEIPPLRERVEDIKVMTEYFLDKFARAMNRKPMRVSAEVLEALTRYTWPGNVRELQNAVERAVVVGTPPVLELRDLPVRITSTHRSSGSKSLAEIERLHILAMLNSSDWNITRASRILELDRGTLYNKIRSYGLKRPVDGP